MMKKITVLLVLIFIVSCTSNTIFEAPKDLIPKDSMQLLMIDMLIAESAKYQKNKNLQKDVNYMPFVYEKYEIDSLRFHKSNVYYTSRIDEYKKMLDTVKSRLETIKKKYATLRNLKDSLKRDSLQKLKRKDNPKVLPPDLKENQ